MSSFGLDFSKNLSYFTIPAVFIATCLAPHSYALACAGKAYDNANPRGFRDRVSKNEELDKPLQQRILRAKGASENGFEALPLFAGAVLAANQVGLDASTINALSFGYLAIRLAYVFAYVTLGENRKLAPVRSLVWAAGVGACLTLWIKAGLKAMQ